jgi:hypothetical protein
MGVGAGIGAAAVLGYAGSQSAANSEKNASSDAIAAQESMFNREQENLSPFRTAGASAIPGLIDASNKSAEFTPADFLANKDPSYDFNVSQGQKGIATSSVARGGLVNAGTLQALSDYSQKMAGNQYQSAYDRYQTTINSNYNRQLGLANLGESAAAGTNAAGMNAANNISSSIIGAGNAAAAGTVGSTNAITGAIGQGIGAYNTNNLLSKIYPQATPPTPNMPSNEEYGQMGMGTGAYAPQPASTGYSGATGLDSLGN